jgi:hypothetical protein
VVIKEDKKEVLQVKMKRIGGGYVPPRATTCDNINRTIR